MPSQERLSAAEIETLRLLAATMTLAEIADELDRTRGVIIAAAFGAGIVVKRNPSTAEVKAASPKGRKTRKVSRKRRVKPNAR